MKPVPVNLSLDQADKFAEKIQDAIAPYCHPGFCEVVGSIRRRRGTCHDIDIVCIPKDLAAVRNRCKQSCTVVADGDQIFRLQIQSARAEMIDIDIYFARFEERSLFGVLPCNWTTLLVQRTGSRMFNKWLCSIAHSKGMQWRPNVGLCRQENVIETPDETAFFSALGLDYIKPEDREK